MEIHDLLLRGKKKNRMRTCAPIFRMRRMVAMRRPQSSLNYADLKTMAVSERLASHLPIILLTAFSKMSRPISSHITGLNGFFVDLAGASEIASSAASSGGDRSGGGGEAAFEGRTSCKSETVTTRYL